MEEIRPSPSPAPPPTAAAPTTTATAPPASDTKSKGEKSVTSRVKKACLAFMVSLQERFRYVKAKFVGQAKKMKARNEKEAAEADLRADKMQVEAADEAENIKKTI